MTGVLAFPAFFGLGGILRTQALSPKEAAALAYEAVYQKTFTNCPPPDLPAIAEAFGPTPKPAIPAFVQYDIVTGKPLYDIDFGALDFSAWRET